MPDPKQRHGCLTAYLVWMLVVNSLAALLYMVGADFLKRGVPNARSWIFPVLFRWETWGFFGLVATAIVALCVNLTVGADKFLVIVGMAGIAILYGVLQIGKETKGWTQLD